jgi:hypothetical protein
MLKTFFLYVAVSNGVVITGEQVWKNHHELSIRSAGTILMSEKLCVKDI